MTTFLDFFPIITWFLAAGALIWITKKTGTWATMPTDQAQKQQIQTHLQLLGETEDGGAILKANGKVKILTQDGYQIYGPIQDKNDLNKIRLRMSRESKVFYSANDIEDILRDRPYRIDMSGNVVRQSHERILVLLRGELITYLINRPVDSDWGLEKLRQDFNWWETKIAEALERAGASDSEVSWLKEVGPYPPTGLPAYNDAHTGLLSLFVEKQKRLEKIMTRLGFFSGG